MVKWMNSITAFNQLNAITRDGRYTQRDLISKIKNIAGNEIGQSVINSFVNDGIIETYNELGYQEWIKMINEIVAHEKYERSR